ncbi:type II secretion system protein [Paenibacillus sp. CGMCC 1.16610]|uniref:Prepilin-type N-terminal cleavage/methylation domain-containing protein n=1 Tax=Paenibacillus anseongense TaxID=2682845 RepID=A0ABW9UFS0_9BACL|nr:MULTISPECIES: type II secretion system protein [Paenibacillus]MBA2940049.1 type II secretion system protein [Paenibacillus sp. CGMCC 1.16610]MVQ39004.1 prepilin-type N-terminal cleavage/methylation domain-containing protein [Paenibacillus anseongense]
MLFKMMKRLKKEEKGFTLIELLAVIVILAVIAAIAVPYILGVINKSKNDADAAFFHQVYEASRLYITTEKGGTPPATVKVLTDLVGNKFLEPGLVLPSTKDPITAGKLEYTDNVLTGIVITTKVDSYTISPVTDVISGKGTLSAATTDYPSESN